MNTKNTPTVAQLEAEWVQLRELQRHCREAIAQRDELLEALQRIAAMSHEEKFAALDMKAAARAAMLKAREGGAA